MKKILFTLIIGIALATSSCSQFTELSPKGRNLLETTDQLELLLNADCYLSSMDFWSMSGDVMYSYSYLPTIFTNPVKNRRVIMATWDEDNQDLMADLTASDQDYTGAFGWVGRVCNPIIAKVDEATGTDAKRKQLKAEAYGMRAYMHYILVNKYAKAYNPTSAETDPGIAYLKEDADIAQMQEKLTVAKVYENILADCDAAIELDALPVTPIHKMRFNKACPYAVKALALMAMQRFDEAETAAKQALAINDEVFNYSENLVTISGYFLGNPYQVVSKPEYGCVEDYWANFDYVYYEVAFPETIARFENGHMYLNNVSSLEMMYDYVRGTEEALGLKDCYTFYDFDSYWNRYGLNTPQMWLIVAEAEIAKNDINKAMNALDKIRSCRIDPAVYAPLEGAVTTKSDAIFHLKQTSHGEGIYSIYNFINRKRWTQLSDYRETYTKTVKWTDRTTNQEVVNVYQLTPDSPLWIFPFPKNVVSVNENMTHNYK